tara:strand:- start:854 stop:1258 length:405 start_codon:yes stop_codon:yes gene_type:complete
MTDLYLDDNADLLRVIKVLEGAKEKLGTNLESYMLFSESDTHLEQQDLVLINEIYIKNKELLRRRGDGLLNCHSVIRIDYSDGDAQNYQVFLDLNSGEITINDFENVAATSVLEHLLENYVSDKSLVEQVRPSN